MESAIKRAVPLFAHVTAIHRVVGSPYLDTHKHILGSRYIRVFSFGSIKVTLVEKTSIARTIEAVTAEVYNIILLAYNTAKYSSNISLYRCIPLFGR